MRFEYRLVILLINSTLFTPIMIVAVQIGNARIVNRAIAVEIWNILQRYETICIYLCIQ